MNSRHPQRWVKRKNCRGKLNPDESYLAFQPPDLPNVTPHGPPPKHMSPNAIVASAKGNSYPPLPVSPFLKCTLQMATAISIMTAAEKKRVNNPSTIAIPPKNSVPAVRYTIHLPIPTYPTNPMPPSN